MSKSISRATAALRDRETHVQQLRTRRRTRSDRDRKTRYPAVYSRNSQHALGTPRRRRIVHRQSPLSENAYVGEANRAIGRRKPSFGVDVLLHGIDGRAGRATITTRV